MAVSICMLNVNGIAKHPKCEKVFKHLLDQHFDIYLLQETHLPDVTQGKLWETQWGGHALWSPGTNRSTGVGLLLRPGSAIEIVGHNSDTDGRVISAKLKLMAHTRSVAVWTAFILRARGDHKCMATRVIPFRTLTTILCPLIYNWGIRIPAGEASGNSTRDC